MRRAITILIGAFLLAQVLLPALPTYVCSGMGGVHLMKPCCPGETTTSAATTAPLLRRARCCDSLPKAERDVQWAPPLKARSLVPVPVAALTPLSFSVPRLLTFAPRALSRGDPTTFASTNQHRVLRI